MIGIRREDKSDWEGRVPLVPADIRQLSRDHGLRFCVQKSPIRAFPEEDYAEAGATVADDLGACPLIMGVKEIPPAKLEPNKAYVYFAHVIKGQKANMPALRRLVELGCTLIDYERIVDAQNRRLVFFGRFAGLAGMIDTLWAFGQRLRSEGIDNPFTHVRPAHAYDDLAHVRRDFAAVAEAIRTDGLPQALRPLVCGFAGYGQVARGAQEIYDLLPVQEIGVDELAPLLKSRGTKGGGTPGDVCYKVVFREEHMVARTDLSQPFELQEYYQHPERYQAAFFQHVPHLSILLNCIYWEAKYPPLITRAQFQELYASATPRLRVIGDITCDIDGSLACTTRSTDPGSPVYVYDPRTAQTTDGVVGRGPVVLAVDFLPCELPVDASNYFSHTLSPFVAALGKADFSKPLAASGLPPELQRATIVYNGRLTEPYRYLEEKMR